MEAIGNYEIQGIIGQGGMCTVYRGRQVSLDRPVAIKVLSDKLIENDEVRTRFERESLIIARLHHPNIIHVIDRGITESDKPYFVMEFIEGTTLADVIKESTVSLNQRLEMIIQVCKALSYAHRNNVIHRDIKPANILIDDENNIHMLDFGIAKFFNDNAPTGDFTRADMVMGTLAYMSPEHRDGMDEVTAASDIYSLGVVMYELFTGIKPMGNFSAPMNLNEEITQDLEDVILSCLKQNPAERLSSVDEIKDTFLSLLQGAHLGTSQRERARRGLARIEDKFSLLDVVRDDEYGAVYLYQDRIDHRLIIIKKLEATKAGLIESQKLTALKHKNIIDILGASGTSERFIMVMEYLGGGSLQDRMIQPIPWGEALQLAKQICKAMAFAHRNRIVHGNLRPSNVLFTEKGGVRVTDFSLVEHYAFNPDSKNWYNIWGEPRSQSADILAVGTIMYEMLTATVPRYEGFELIEDEYFQVLPIALQNLVRGLMASNPAERMTSLQMAINTMDTLLVACEENPELPGATVIVPLEELHKKPSIITMLFSRLALPFSRIFSKKTSNDESLVA